jgi:hypothetical protein
MQVYLSHRMSTESSQPRAAVSVITPFFQTGAALVQFLNYLIVGLLVSCVMALAWAMIFPV